MLFDRLLGEFFLIVLLHILGTLHNESRATHSRVADSIIESGLHQFHHHADYVARSTELSVGATGRHLAKHIFIDIAHSIAVVHIKCADTIDNFDKCARILNHKDRIFHKSRICRLLTPIKVLYVRKHIAADHTVHLFRLEMSEITPTQISHRYILICVRIMPCAVIKHRLTYLCPQCRSLAFLTYLGIIEHLHKQKICHLFKKRYGVGDTSRPEGFPYLVNLRFNLSCNHTLEF